MHPRTLATLDRLSEVDWFRSVGVADAETATVVGSWAEAVEQCSSPGWLGLTQEAVNQYRARIQESSPEHFGNWNEIVLDLRPFALALARDKTNDVIAENALPPAFFRSVAWDILHLCIEAELADVYPPGFFAAQSYWYSKGHFPCGWEGPFPDGGTLIVY